MELGPDEVEQVLALIRERLAEIGADAAVAILRRDAKGCTGNFFIDDEVLRAGGVADLGRYAVAPDGELVRDLFLE